MSHCAGTLQTASMRDLGIMLTPIVSEHAIQPYVPFA